ncbi:hypothetical protein [Amycolatopsis pittospori]|uniref:hypothetical protein n=1 Tax=Amycolatopsis pittospori TaxID=2749434 RepID=UPI0015F0FC14|nr:hypothetical protein [Amycolatopsis pittospori]
MTGGSWARVPGSRTAERWLTRTGCRRVLAVVPHMTAGTRLADVLPLLEADHRVQVAFTIPDGPDTWPGVDEYLRRSGGLVLPWHQALRMRFDLALAASYVDIDKVDAPVMVLPHGTGGIRSRVSPQTVDVIPGHPRDLLVRDGRVVPEAVVFAHEDDAQRMRRAFPEAASRVVVAGDVCYDRIRASMPLRLRYRDAAGVEAHQKLVMVSSTWSQHSLFGGNLDLITRLATCLPRHEYQVMVALHPLTWSAHGARQVRAWLAEALEAGIRLLPPDEGWRAALVASDCVIGDHGSVTQYAAGLGRPVLLNPGSALDVRKGSLAGRLWKVAPVLDPARPLRTQVEDLVAACPRRRLAAIEKRITSMPGGAGVRLREEIYRILGIREPDRPVRAAPVPLLTRESPGI